MRREGPKWSKLRVGDGSLGTDFGPDQARGNCKTLPPLPFCLGCRPGEKCGRSGATGGRGQGWFRTPFRFPYSLRGFGRWLTGNPRNKEYGGEFPSANNEKERSEKGILGKINWVAFRNNVI